VRTKKRYSVVSLYTGAGGLDLGFERAGFATRVAVEMDSVAVATLRHNRDWPVIDHDIHSAYASSAAIRKTAHLGEGEADVLIGGPPCQPFSKSGYWANGDSQRLADPRSSTLGAYLRVLEDLKPRAFLLENVPGIAFSNKDEGLSFLKRELLKINRRIGCNYSFSAQLLKAVEFGVPQDRHRVFVIGSRDGHQFEFPKGTHYGPEAAEGSADLFDRQRLRFHTAWDAIADLQDDDDPALKVTGKWAELLPSIPEGSNYLFHTDRGDGLQLFGWRRRYWSFLLKLSKTLPSWTIAAQPGPAIGPFHWRNRRLSARELCRLQTFPDDFFVTGTLRSIQRQLGNAVPSALAEKLALEIRRQFFGDSLPEDQVGSLAPIYRKKVPPPERRRKVPRKYLSLIGEHESHPGTGKGYRASMRR
jgi:DNA (cytosine-5)-methyltransferase 1